MEYFLEKENEIICLFEKDHVNAFKSSGWTECERPAQKREAEIDEVQPIRRPGRPKKQI